MTEEKVLVIDQDEASCNLIKDVLGSRGFQVRVALTARVGLEANEVGRDDLVFLDRDIRDLEARVIVRELKRRDEHVAVILMSHEDDGQLIQESLSLEVADYLYKPLRSREVYFKARHAVVSRVFLRNHAKSLKGFEERNISLQKQNILLAMRIEESTKNLSRLYEDLRETYMRTIKALAHAIDARDHYTFSHSDNVTRYAELIARHMRLDMRAIENIMDACQLHDLGKIGVQDSVLAKPGSLSQEEYEQIKQHARKGAQILEPLTFLEDVIKIVMHHHERWDGKGYPDGLKEDAIPLGARIMAVADSYDAMSSARPYRRIGMTSREAVEEVKKNNGTQFDPRVVESFLAVVDKF